MGTIMGWLVRRGAERGFWVWLPTLLPLCVHAVAATDATPAAASAAPAASPSAVTGAMVGDAPIQTLGPVTVRASVAPAPEPTISALNTITVSQAEMLRYGDLSIADTLRRAAGIQTGGGGVRGSRFRGGSAPPEFLINGEPVQGGRRGGQTLIDGLTPDMIDRIEITRQASVTQASGGSGGVVNIILKNPRAGQHGGVVKIGAGVSGSGNERDARNQISLQHDGRRSDAPLAGLGYSISANRMDNRVNNQSVIEQAGQSRIQQTQSHSTHAMLMPRLEWQVTEQRKWALDGMLGRFDSQNTSSAVGGLTQTTQTQTQPLRVNLRHEQGNEKTHKGTVRLSLGHESEQQDTSSGSTPHIDERTDEASVGYSASQRLGSAHQLKYGTQWRHSRIQNNINADLTQDNLAVYLEENWKIAPAHTVTIGVRQERVQRSGLVDHRNDHTNPSLAYLYKPNPQWSWQIGYSETTRVQRSEDLVPTVTVATGTDAGSLNNPDQGGNPALRPEKLHALESTIGYNSPDGGFNLTGFYRLIDDYTETAIALENGRHVQRPQNRAEATASGIELNGRYAFKKTGGQSWLINGQVSTIRAVIDSPGQASRLASGVAPYTASAGLSWQHQPKRLSASASINYTPAYSRPLDQQPYTRHVNARPSVDASVTQRFKDGWALTLSGRNLLAPNAVSSLEDAQGNRVQSRDTSAEPAWLLHVEKRF